MLDHYRGAGDGQCAALKKDGERCTNGVYGDRKHCGTHMNVSDARDAPDDRTIWERYQDANQAYVVLGVTHFALFATGMTGAGLREGTSTVASVAVGVLIGLVFLLLFFHLGEYHGEAGSGKLVASEASDNND